MTVTESLLERATSRGWFTVSEAAAYLAVTPATVRRWVHSGDLAGWRVGPKLIRIDLDAVLGVRHGVDDASR